MAFDGDVRVVYTNGLKKILEGYASIDHTYSVLQGARVEICEIPSNSYPPGITNIRLNHQKEGYESFLLYCPQYGIANGIFAYVRDSDVDTAEIYVQNRSDKTVTMSLGESIWLSCPILVDDNP